MSPAKTPVQASEHPEPHELGRPVPIALRVIAVLLVAWGIFYIARSQPPGTVSAEYGDQRTLADLSPKAATGSAGGVDGAAIYSARCAACHQATGIGTAGVFPPLAGSEWVASSDAALIQILLLGVQGPLTVKGQSYNGAMPAFNTQLNDEEIAAVATYVRSQWGNKAAAIDAAKVAEQRATTASRTAPWNGDAELNALK